MRDKDNIFNDKLEYGEISGEKIYQRQRDKRQTKYSQMENKKSRISNDKQREDLQQTDNIFNDKTKNAEYVMISKEKTYKRLTINSMTK